MDLEFLGSFGYTYESSLDYKPPIQESLKDYEISGWVVLDDSDELWFFHGSDNIPIKEGGEWIGLNPIHLQKRFSNPPPKDLKTIPEFITFTVK